MSRFLKIISVMILLGFLITCGGSDSGTVEQAQIPASNEIVTFSGITWSDVKFKHKEHSDRYGGECIRCHDHESVAGQTHWYCRSCHTAGQDREALCTEVSEHGCIMTQCNNCHEVKALNPGLGCMSCHPGGQLSGTDGQPPSVPAGLTATAVSASQVNLSWTASTDNMAVAGYKIYRNGLYIKPVTGATTTTDTVPSASTTYCYEVTAYDAAANESGKSTQSCATTLADTSTPTAPTALASIVSDPTTVTLNWTGSTDDVGVSNYRIYRNGALLKSVAGTLTATTDSLASNTLSCYQVAAWDGANESVKSNLSCPGTAVVSGTAPGGATSVTLEDSIDQPSRVHHWNLTLATAGTLIIDVEAWERCESGTKVIPTDFFGDGENNNSLHANLYLFDSGGNAVAWSIGLYSADAGGRFPPTTPAPPGVHNTRSGQNPYINVPLPAGTYKLAVGSLVFSEADARNGINTNGSDWKNVKLDGVTPTYNKYRAKVYFTSP